MATTPAQTAENRSTWNLESLSDYFEYDYGPRSGKTITRAAASAVRAHLERADQEACDQARRWILLSHWLGTVSRLFAGPPTLPNALQAQIQSRQGPPP